MTPGFTLTLEAIDRLVDTRVVEEYWERGYWRTPKLIDDATIARLRRAHERLWRGEFDREIPSQYGPPKPQAHPGDLRQQCNAFWLNDEIRRVVTAPELGCIGAKLMKAAGVRLWHDQAIYKPGTGGAPVEGKPSVGWHQDFAYWRCTDTTNMCTAWIALQDTDLANGGMRTIVGSHKWGVIADSNKFWSQTLDADARDFANVGKSGWIDEPCILKAGEVSFHHALTFHGSGPNSSAEPRLAVVAHMMPDGTRYRPGEKLHPNLVFLGPDARAGDAFVGPYWPRLWPPGA
jgi:ectoine hydroxylase-related dioxygenase (phytanoyl-CoA dioxygenase family)